MENITSRANNRVKQIVALCESDQARKEAGNCVVHGIKLCCECVRLGAQIREMWFTETAEQKYSQQINELKGSVKKLVLMSDSVCDKLTPQRTPQGVFAVVALPKTERGVSDTELLKSKRIIALCAIQDPANVGAMVRTAAAVGFGGAVLSKDCADPFSPKSLRASMGAVFAIPISFVDSELAAVLELQKNGYTVIATALTDSAINISEIKKSEKLAIAIGNEGNGLCAQTIDQCDITATIPITDNAESLNAAAAAAITMWELRA